MKKWRTEAKRPRKICGLAERLSPVNRIIPREAVARSSHRIDPHCPQGAAGPSLIYLGRVAPFVRRQRHHSIMDRGGNSQRAMGRLLSPGPPQVEGILFVRHENASRSAGSAARLPRVFDDNTELWTLRTE